MSGWNIIFKPFSELLSNVVDNRGRTCPTAPSGLALIATNCIRNDNLYPVYENVRYVSDETYRAWFRGHPLPGDLIFVTKGTPGRVCVVPPKVDFCIAQDMVAIRADNKKVSPKYLFAALRSAEIQSEIENLHVGSLIPHFKKGDFDKLQIPLPEREVQEYIGEQYFTFSAKIDLLHRQNKTLEGMAEALWRKMFVEEVDPGWKKGKLGDVIAIKHGYAFKGAFITDQKTNKILITPGNFRIGGGFKEEKFKYYSSDDYPKEYVFGSDELIVTMTDLSKEGDTLGYPAIISVIDGKVLLHNQRVGKISFLNDKKTLFEYFVYFLMRTDDYRAYILGSASGTSILHTSPERICNYEIMLPNENNIKDYNNSTTDIVLKIKKNTIQIRSLSHLRDTLLPKLMSGEVRVRL